MSLGEKKLAKPSSASLRVFDPDAADQSDVVPATGQQTEVQQPPAGSDPEVEAFWAGRTPAGRLSARIAA